MPKGRPGRQQSGRLVGGDMRGKIVPRMAGQEDGRSSQHEIINRLKSILAGRAQVFRSSATGSARRLGRGVVAGGSLVSAGVCRAVLPNKWVTSTMGRMGEPDCQLPSAGWPGSRIPDLASWVSRYRPNSRYPRGPAIRRDAAGRKRALLQLHYPLASILSTGKYRTRRRIGCGLELLRLTPFTLRRGVRRCRRALFKRSRNIWMGPIWTTTTQE